MLVDALLVGLLCGAVGVLVDLDHIIGFVLRCDGRVFHKAMFIGAGVVCFGVIAYIGGLVC